MFSTSQRRIVIAPDKFKGSLSAGDAAAAIARGWRAVRGEADTLHLVPMADGGEGTVEAFLDAGALRCVRSVRGPLGDEVRATFALDGTTALIEMAAASGLEIAQSGGRDALRADSYGTGELIGAALDVGAERIVVGIGGSATTDGGAGMLRALGARLLDAAGREIGPGGAALADLATVDLSGLDRRLNDAAIDVAADVDNPLCGPAGASAVFAPQKGALAPDVARLDMALAHWADVSAQALGADHRDVPGAGAAGGLGFALVAYFGARVRPGVDVVAEIRGVPALLEGAALCLTGEGSIDEQTLRGKTVDGIARLAARAEVPTVAFGGRIELAAERALAGRGVICMPLPDGILERDSAFARAGELLERAAARVARLRAGS